MTCLIATVAFWILIHRLISGGPLREILVGRLGEKIYRALFAALSVASLTALAVSYGAARTEAGGVAPPWLVVALAVIHLFATLLAVTGLSIRNPTTAGMAQMARRPNVVHGMLRVTRHPFLWGVAIWSMAHLVVCRDTAGLVFFGALGLVALMGTRSIDRKRQLALGQAWTDFARQTSSVPFAAIAAGRQAFSLREIGPARVAISLLVWAALLALHPYLGGSNVLGRLLSP